MKRKDIDISYAFRSLLQDINVSALVLEIYKEAKISKGKFIHYPKNIYKCYDMVLNKVYELSLEDYDKEINKCEKMSDNLYIELLIREKIIFGKYGISISKYEKSVDDGHKVLEVEEIDMDRFKEHVEWIKDSSLIRNYEIFSLHTFTGKAYCLNNSCVFHTDKGLFRVFKAFIEEPTHILSFKQIFQIYHGGTSEALTLKLTPQDIYQIIGEIREKLQMKGKLSKLFLPSGDKYLLKSLN